MIGIVQFKRMMQLLIILLCTLFLLSQSARAQSPFTNVTELPVRSEWSLNLATH